MTGGALESRVVVARRGGFTLDVPVAADPGEILAVMGPSGAGKSTLLAAIAGLVRLTDGYVRIGGTDVASAAPRRHVSPARRGAVLLGQEPRLFPHLSARENVAFGPRSQGVAKREAARDADEWLWRVGLPGMGGRRPGSLSGGQQQRVAIARALATDPKVLLLDEPLTSLDAETAGDIRALLAEQLATTRATAVIVTHDAVDAAALAHRLIVVESGAIAQQGPVRDVLQTPATSFVAAASGVNRLIGRAHAGGWVAGRADRADCADTGPVLDPEPTLHTADATSRAAAAHDGAELAAFVRPSAVGIEPVPETTWTGALRLELEQVREPGSWLARVERLEPTPAGVRVRLADPALAADIPVDAVADMGLAPGRPVRVRVDAGDVRFARVGQ